MTEVYEVELTKAGAIEVGFGGVTRIVLRRDGAGPMGWYDVIYVYADDSEEWWRVMPAHLVGTWGR